MTVRRISKRGVSRSVEVAGAGTVTLGKAIEVETSGHVRVALDSGEEVSARVPMHIDLQWLTTALALAPVEVAVAFTTSRSALLWCVFPGPEHASVRREIAAPDIVIRADHSLELRCGDASVTLDGRGGVRAEGKEILSRASGAHRIQGGSVRVN
jgi:hypothetical protein